MPIHRELSGEQIHAPYTWEFTDETARTSETITDATMEGKLAWQKSDDTIWMLVGTDPAVWQQLLEDSPSDGSVYARQDGIWIEVDAAGTVSPTVSTGDATTVLGESFVVPVTLSAFGSIDTSNMKLAVEYKVAGATEWSITAGVDKSTVGTEDITVSGLTESTTYDYRAVGYSAINPNTHRGTGTTKQETTPAIYIATPTNTDPTDTESDIGEIPTLTSSAFSCVNGSDTHASSDWEIYDGVTLIYSSYDDASNKTTLTVPVGELEVSTTYTWKVRHTGTTYGDSEWSTATSFTTKAAFALIYGIAQVTTGGGAGSWARVDADGNNLTLITTDFDNHPVWGGMVTETIDGQEMVKVPKFYFKVADAPVGSDRAGKKCWWISEAPVAGFALHPAFMDTGVEIDQFWMGAYEASNDGGTTVKSVAGVTPLADVSFDGFVTRIAARNTGGVDGFHMPDIHELGAVQMLALIEMGTPDALSAISVGNDTGSKNNTEVDADVYRGIYQLWSNVYMWVDGLRTTTAETIKIYDDQGNQTWVVVDTGLSANRDGWPVTMKEDVGTGYDLTGLFIADTLDGTETNGTFAGYQAFNKPSAEDFVCRHGGGWDGSASDGLFSMSVGSVSSYADEGGGGRLAKR